MYETVIVINAQFNLWVSWIWFLIKTIFIYLSICLHLSIYLSIYLSVYLSIYTSINLSNSKQIYHSWEALVESMGSEVPSTVLFSEGRSPEENGTVEGTEGP